LLVLRLFDDAVLTIARQITQRLMRWEDQHELWIGRDCEGDVFVYLKFVLQYSTGQHEATKNQSGYPVWLPRLEPSTIQIETQASLISLF
jgi:hypothetical protein